MAQRRRTLSRRPRQLATWSTRHSGVETEQGRWSGRGGLASGARACLRQPDRNSGPWVLADMSCFEGDLECRRRAASGGVDRAPAGIQFYRDPVQQGCWPPRHDSRRGTAPGVAPSTPVVVVYRPLAASLPRVTLLLDLSDLIARLQDQHVLPLGSSSSQWGLAVVVHLWALQCRTFARLTWAYLRILPKRTQTLSRLLSIFGLHKGRLRIN